MGINYLLLDSARKKIILREAVDEKQFWDKVKTELLDRSGIARLADAKINCLKSDFMGILDFSLFNNYILIYSVGYYINKRYGFTTARGITYDGNVIIVGRGYGEDYTSTIISLSADAEKHVIDGVKTGKGIFVEL